MGALESFQTSNAAALSKSLLIQQSCDRPCIVASVVRAFDNTLRKVMSGRRIHWLDTETHPEVDFSMVDCTTVGTDRVANAIAAARLLRLPAVVVDCGTAVTMEVIDASRRFRGGCILPGRNMARAALADATDRLPLVKLAHAEPPAIGSTTADAIRAGIDIGTLGAVDRILDRIQEMFCGQELHMVAVGGDAAYFATHMARLRHGPDHFTLRGLAVAAETVFCCRD